MTNRRRLTELELELGRAGRGSTATLFAPTTIQRSQQLKIFMRVELSWRQRRWQS
jgi:hypothetical protein